MPYYKVVVTETGRNTLKDQAHTFNQESQSFRTLGEVKVYLIDRYGAIPKRTTNNTIYRDDKDGNAHIVGFSKSFWNKDYSHNSPSWYQTDWVEVTKVTEKPVLVN